MQTEESGSGRLLQELRPSWHLYGTYLGLIGLGWGTTAWLLYGDSPWRWLMLLTGLALPTGVVGIALGVWGLWGLFKLGRRRLRLYENGLYDGPASGRRGTFLAYDQILALEWDIVRFPAPLEPLVGHYRITGGQQEILLFSSLYPNMPAVAQTISQKTGREWAEIQLSRGHRH